MKTPFFATKLGIDIFLFFFIFLFDFLPFFLFSSTSSVSSGEINYSQLVLIQYTLCIVLLHHTFVIAEWICNPLSFAFAYKSSLQRVVPPRNRIKNPSNEIFHKNNFHVNIMAPLGGITRPTCWKSNNPRAWLLLYKITNQWEINSHVQKKIQFSLKIFWIQVND